MNQHHNRNTLLNILHFHNKRSPVFIICNLQSTKARSILGILDFSFLVEIHFGSKDLPRNLIVSGNPGTSTFSSSDAKTILEHDVPVRVFGQKVSKIFVLGLSGPLLDVRVLSPPTKIQNHTENHFIIPFGSVFR